ncbi:DUF4097 family beta strand repeat-containing protein [Paenibacillus arenosi]|uniref:DUF4097 family beta strand repeat protein n=1 Tax=Paenibacillus arenosi TaxID=2774142 RepID=A0ABR9AVN0_9BACL|nr:DUF4097 family beta strand repeat-containing protein [Paenibacillus arenosi]MBD8497287.1 DUF4097 family beta strand repeat protein [Paenibacillus arenosi]
MVSLKDIHTIYINHGSTALHVSSFEAEELNASFIASDDGSGIKLDKSKSELNISLKSDIRRILNLREKPELFVQIPAEYKGRVIINGSSGHVHIQDTNAELLEIKGKSGNITMNFLGIKNHIDISASSGNVLLKLKRKDSDARWLLQTSSGKRSIAFSLDNHTFNNKKTEGLTGNGTYSVQMKTSSGNITVE